MRSGPKSIYKYSQPCKALQKITRCWCSQKGTSLNINLFMSMETATVPMSDMRMADVHSRASAATARKGDFM